MPSIRKTPSLSPETRLRVLHEQRDKRAGEIRRLQREFNRRYPTLDVLSIDAWKELINKEWHKLEKVERAIERLVDVTPAKERQMTFGWER